MSRSGQQRQRGFGLVEIMVALVLGLLLTAAAVQAFLAHRASYRFNDNLASLQDNARFALHTLAHDLRMSGYTGCPQPVSTAPILNAGGNTKPSPFGAINVMAKSLNDSGYDTDTLMADAVSLPGNDLPGRAVGGTDAVRISYMRDFGARVTDSESNKLVLSTNPAGWGDSNADSLLLVTDCNQADLFATDGNGGDASCTSAGTTLQLCAALNEGGLSRTYGENARVFAPYEVVYYIGNPDDQTDDAGKPVSSLYRVEVFSGTPSSKELVANVSNLTLRYGEDTTGDGAPDRYVAAASVSDWQDVVALRLGFIAGSGRRAGSGERSDLSIFGTDVNAPDDGHLRRVFTTTIALRNRVR